MEPKKKRGRPPRYKSAMTPAMRQANYLMERRFDLEEVAAALRLVLESEPAAAKIVLASYADQDRRQKLTRGLALCLKQDHPGTRAARAFFAELLCISSHDEIQAVDGRQTSE